MPLLVIWSDLTQDAFVKTMEKTYTETDKESSKLSVGFYSEEEMKTQLKWPKNLDDLPRATFSNTVGRVNFFDFLKPVKRIDHQQPKEKDWWGNPALHARWRKSRQAR